MANSTSSKVAKYRLCVASLRASFYTRSMGATGISKIYWPNVAL